MTTAPAAPTPVDDTSADCGGSWLSWRSPVVYSTVVTGAPVVDFVIPDPPDPTVADALATASEILLRLTGYLVHPAGEAEEDYVASPRIRRLTPNWRPLRAILSADAIADDCVLDALDPLPCIIGQDAYFNAARCTLNDYLTRICGCPPSMVEAVRLRYRFGSTVTASGRRAVLYLARQMWLQVNPSQGECELPERVTSVNREGLSYTIFDPQSYLMEHKTGLPSVDLWLAAVNPYKATRPSGVWTPDAPPAVNRTIRWHCFEPVAP